MKLSNFDRVQQLIAKRTDLTVKLDHISTGNYDNSGLGITIRGQYQDDDMINACRQGARMEMERRIREIERELTLLGVIVEE